MWGLHLGGRKIISKEIHKYYMYYGKNRGGGVEGGVGVLPVSVSLIFNINGLFASNSFLGVLKLGCTTFNPHSHSVI